MFRAVPGLTAPAIVALVISGAGLFAQSGPSQLGLTEAAARTFLFDELKAPTTESFARRSAIVLAGTRAFLKLPPSARGPASTALFAWAKAYVNSPAFKTAYANYRRDATPSEIKNAETLDEAVKKNVDAGLAAIEETRQGAASLPPDIRAKFLETIKQQEAQLRSPDYAKTIRTALELERADQGASALGSARAAAERLPADPEQLYARRLREFLAATADANFSARTISLTGGPDGIEFVDPVDRKRPWMWEAAVIVGREATTAARAAADAWLKEIER